MFLKVPRNQRSLSGVGGVVGGSVSKAGEDTRAVRKKRTILNGFRAAALACQCRAQLAGAPAVLVCPRENTCSSQLLHRKARSSLRLR